jgi:hypothetical protein
MLEAKNKTKRNRIGNWISNKTDKPFYLRKEFTVRTDLKAATVKVTGLGQFAFYINGRKIGNHELDPGWTNYNKKILYVVFDIKNEIISGKNAVGIEVANGWYIADRSEEDRYFFSMPPKRPEFSFMPPNPNPYQPFGDYLTACAEILLEYEDGTTERIITDQSWRTRESALLYSNVYGSEIYDARRYPKGWNHIGFNDEAWDTAIILEKEEEPKGELYLQTQPPLVIKKTYHGRILKEVEPGAVLFDLGQNMSGLFEITVCGKSGTRIDIYPAEKLGEDGNIDQFAHGWTPVNTFTTYVIAEDEVEENYCPQFCYGAGRYLLIKGVSVKPEDPMYPYISSVKGHFITSDCEEAGSFQCDDKRYEQIYDLVEKAVESNLHSVHTDCPGIEKIAWQEPNHLMAPSIMYMKNVKSLWEKYLHDLRIDQWKAEDYAIALHGEKIYFGEGLIPSQAPCYEKNVLPVPGIGSFFDIIPWGSTIILAPYWHYMFYGDINIVKENYEAGVKYLRYLKTKVNEEGFINHGLGDWGNPDKKAFARENIETAFLYADTITLAKFALLLGLDQDKAEFDDYAKSIKENYNKKLLVKHPEQDFYCYQAFDHPEEVFLTQACQALPLYWGLVPEEREEEVVKALKFVLERDGAYVSGEVGLPYIIQSMKKYGMNQMINDFILKEEHPSYYAFILGGETTLPEYWEENARSHNHDMMGHIIEWYYNGIAGIEPLEPGFTKIMIKPFLPQSMKELSCSYESVRGRIDISVKELEEEIMIHLNVPNGVYYKFDDSQLAVKNKKIQLQMTAI